MPNIEKKVEEFLAYIRTNGNIEKLGTNEDNKSERVHRWFSFLPGFSHIFVRTMLQYFGNDDKNNTPTVFDPFMGSATTAVVGKQLGINVVGNDAAPGNRRKNACDESNEGCRFIKNTCEDAAIIENML